MKKFKDFIDESSINENSAKDSNDRVKKWYKENKKAFEAWVKGAEIESWSGNSWDNPFSEKTGSRMHPLMDSDTPIRVKE